MTTDYVQKTKKYTESVLQNTEKVYGMRKNYTEFRTVDRMKMIKKKQILSNFLVAQPAHNHSKGPPVLFDLWKITFLKHGNLIDEKLQFMSTLNTSNTKSKHHRFIFKCFKPYLSFFNRGRVFPSDTKKIQFYFPFFSRLCYACGNPPFLKDSSLLCTYSSSCPLPHKNIGPVLTKNEWDSFKSGSALRLTSFLVFSVDTASILHMFAPAIFTFRLPWFTFWEQGHILDQSPHITLRPCPFSMRSVTVDGNEGMGGKLVTELGNETRDLGFYRPLFNDSKKMIWALSQLPTSPIVTFLP